MKKKSNFLNSSGRPEATWPLFMHPINILVRPNHVPNRFLFWVIEWKKWIFDFLEKTMSKNEKKIQVFWIAQADLRRLALIYTSSTY